MTKSFKELQQILEDWIQANPDHCPECFCRPGQKDSEGGTDHEEYCDYGLDNLA